MKSWGIWLIILGIGSFVLPLFGLQFVLLSIFGEARAVVAASMIIIGGVLLALSAKH